MSDEEIHTADFKNEGEPAADSCPSPQLAAKKAALVAARTAALAAALHDETARAMAAGGLRDLKLPCVPISPTAAATESRRGISADHVLPSPWCEGTPVPGPVYDVPQDNALELLDDKLRKGLKKLSLGQRPVGVTEASLLAEILSKPSSLMSLNLQRSLDPALTPPVPADLLQEEVDRLEAEVGPEEEEGAVEKLQALCEKSKVEFVADNYEEMLKAIAAKKFDPVVVLLRGLENCVSLTTLDLSHNGFGTPNAEGRVNYRTLRRIAAFIDSTAHLLSLDLSGNNMGPVGVGIIAKAMTKNVTIRTLNLSGNDVNGDAPDEEEDADNDEGDPVFGELLQGLEALSEMLKKNKFLKVLSLRSNRLKADIEIDAEDDGMDTPLGKLIEPLKKYYRLEVLDLASNELGDAGARVVASAIIENRSLRALDLSDNKIGLAGLQWIAKLITSNGYLSQLHLERNNLTWNRKSNKANKAAMKTVNAFSAALAQNKGLTDLNLGGHHFGVEVSDALLLGFATSRVVSLNFESNNLCGEPDAAEPDTRALEKILDATRRPEFPVKALRLASNRILTRGAELIAACVLPHVEELDLGRNFIGDAGLSALCKALEGKTADGRATSLRTLRLPYNALSDITTLARSLDQVASLTSLDLSHNRIGASPAAFAEFLNAVGGGALLKDLDLSSNALGTSPAHIEALESLFCRSLPPLSRIDLYDNPAITLSDTLRLVTALKDNRGLRSVRISSQAGDRYQLAECAAQILQTNTTMVDLDLCFGRDTDDDESLGLIRARLLDNALRAL